MINRCQSLLQIYTVFKNRLTLSSVHIFAKYTKYTKLQDSYPNVSTHFSRSNFINRLLYKSLLCVHARGVLDINYTKRHLHAHLVDKCNKMQGQRYVV